MTLPMRTILEAATATLAMVAGMLWAGNAVAAEPAVPPAQLCIYYGWPSYVNGSGGDAVRAAAQFIRCDLVVLGDGIEHPAHGDYASAASIVATLRQAGKEVFGYIDLGVTTQNLSPAHMERYVDEWRAMGASGIFLDDAGYDYGVSRARQDEVIDYVHGQGMSVFINAWNIDDALADVDETGHSSPSRLGPGDIYLAESWLVAGGAYQSILDWAQKADRALQYMRAKQVRVAGVSTAALNKAVASNIGSSKFKMGFWGAAMYNLSAWQWTDVGYSSGNDRLPFYDTASWTYGTSFHNESIAHTSGARRNERATESGRIVVRGNGTSTGTGEFIPY